MKASLSVGIFLVSLLLATSVRAQISAIDTGSGRPNPDSLTIVTRDGKVYHNVTVQKVAPDGLLISYSPASGGVGISKLKFGDLPDAVRRRYGYNPTNAMAFAHTELQNEGRLRAQMLAADEQARLARVTDDISNAWTSAQASGTGFFITDNGYLLTCNHVVAKAASIMVGTKQGVFPADLVQSDEDHDVALLKVEGTFASLPLAASNAVKLGESVFTVGFPNPGVQGMQPKLTRGEISSLTGVRDDPGEYQISVPVQPGNSGGAVVDEYGNVTGLVSARLSDQAALVTSGMTAQDVNYAVKSSCAQTLLEAIPGSAGKLKPPHPLKARNFADVVQEAQDAVVLVMAY